MGDLRPQPTAATCPNDGLLSQSPEQSTALPADPQKTAPSTSSSHGQPRLGRGSAIFSTDLGRRAPRKLQGPPYAPVIVRSNQIPDVVNAAALWRTKYPYQYLCIFPHAGWKIDDLWDEEDIHLETESFCKQVLQFIERDNGVRAQMYATDWSYMHPELLPIVGGDLTELYDKDNPLSIVDKIFVDSESREYPPTFLWHVAHIMRKAMLAVKGVTLPVKEATDVSESLGVDSKDIFAHSASQGTPAPGKTAIVPPVRAPSVNAPSHVSSLAAPMVDLQPRSAQRRDQMPAQCYVPEGSAHPSVREHVAYAVSGQRMGSPDVVHAALRMPRTRQGRSASETYQQPMQFVENMPRVPSGLGPRQHVRPMPMVQSPRYKQAHMVVNQSMGNVHPGMMPMVYEQLSMPAGIVAGPPHPQDTMHPGMIHPHAMIRNASMTHGYPRQISSSQGVPYAAPMGDLTNMPYAMGVPPQHFNSPHSGDGRLNQQYMNVNALYDPYEGNNPAFKGSWYSNGNGKKNKQSDVYNSSGRQRKASHPGNRPYQNQYTNGRSGSQQTSGKRIHGSKPYLENDLAITQDHEYGCSENWIGPRNETVNELYVKDLPEDIEAAELEAMFQDRLGVKPISIIIKGSHFQGWKHAFVGFSSTSIAKQGLLIRDTTIRGLPVSITVPRRFFQKTVEAPPRDAMVAGSSQPYSRFTANPNNGDDRSRKASLDNGDDAAAFTTAVDEAMSYSPQDARSGLHKKKKGKQSQQGSTAADSPEARKTKLKKRQGSSIEPIQADAAEAMSNGATEEAEEVGNSVAASGAAPVASPTSELQTQQPHVDEFLPSDREEMIPIPEAEEGDALETTPPFEKEYVAIKPVSDTTTVQQNDNTAVEQVPQFQHNIELRTEDELKQGSNEHSLAVYTSPEQGPAPMAPLELGTKEPYQELKTGSSIQTATEPHSDLLADLEPVADATNQGEASTGPSVATNTHDDPSTLPASDHRAATVDTGDLQENTAISEPLVPETKTVVMTPVISQAAEDSTTAQQDTLPVNTAPAVLDYVKKSGAQHTESLHPFSKAAKAQAKREKEQKKKAQRKEKEQTEKAKAAKAASTKAAPRIPSEYVEPAKTNSTSEKVANTRVTKPENQHEPTKKTPGLLADIAPLASNADGLTTKTSLPKPKPAVTPSGTVADNVNKSSKQKGKRSAELTIPDIGTAERDDEDHGKQTGVTFSISKELSSVTNKEVSVNLPEETQALGAQFSKPEHVDEASGTTKESAPTVRFAEGTAPAAKKKKSKPKKKKKVPAWPSLEFRLKSPNPDWMGPIDMASDVQHYDEIMNRACGRDDDSDFSWSDLPLVEDEMSYDEEELEEGDETAEQDLEAIQKRIAELQSQQVPLSSTPSYSAADIAAIAESGQSNNAVQNPADRSIIAALQTQIAATKQEIHTHETSIAQLAKSIDTQEASIAAVPVGKKKKKPNNRKNKKKKIAENAETGEARQAGDIVESNETVGSTSNMNVGDLIDKSDPFYDQLKEIEDTKRGKQVTPTLRGGHAEAATTCDEPQLMRTMEAYFKETQGPGQSQARKASQKDLHG